MESKGGPRVPYHVGGGTESTLSQGKCVRESSFFGNLMRLDYSHIVSIG